VQQAHEAATQAKQLLEALSAIPDLQSLLLMPNADAGGESIRQVFQDAESCRCRTAVHLPRLEFIEWMAAVDVMVGNSSSGIIEAASFGTPVVNIGNRQSGRERNANVLDVPPNGGAIEQAIRRALAGGRSPAGNIYGSGDAAERIVSLLEAISLGPDLLMKQNAY
jgi:GDP/UDP-N,N'-diacetylbacillosamine 2-epimerase (hydrolysing)